MYLQFPTATNSKNTEMCKAPIVNSWPPLTLTWGKVSSIEPTMIPP